MKTLGVIAEYNPFHNGHLYHLNESKKISGAEACVAVMSGNFMQRGDVAVLSKWERAKIAVGCGVDLVLELPFVYACNNAEYFAKGAVQILDGISCVDTISFGSESGNIEKLASVAKILLHETPEFKEAMAESLEKGSSFPKARADAMRATFGEEEAEILETPNNILAIEYIKEFMRIDSNILPLTVQRKGQSHNEVLAQDFASATGIRKSIEEGNTENIKKHVPKECFEVLENLHKTEGSFNEDKDENLFLLVCGKIFSHSETELEEIFSAGEGLGFKMKKAVRNVQTLEDLTMEIKSKRYTRTRIQRLLMHTLFDFKGADFREILDSKMNYARVLAFNEKGASLLKQIKKTEPKIPVITNINKQFRDDSEVAKLLHYDILASDIYNLISDKDVRKNSDFVMSPYVGTEVTDD